jgi:hypothetical protein
MFFTEDCMRAGGAELVSPALQRGEKALHKFVTESRRDGARTLFNHGPLLQFHFGPSEVNR